MACKGLGGLPRHERATVVKFNALKTELFNTQTALRTLKRTRVRFDRLVARVEKAVDNLIKDLKPLRHALRKIKKRLYRTSRRKLKQHNVRKLLKPLPVTLDH